MLPHIRNTFISKDNKLFTIHTHYSVFNNQKEP